MDEQQTLNKFKLRNKIFVTWPVGITTICLGLVGSGTVSPLWGVLIGFAIVFLLLLASIFGSVLADMSAAQAAANRRGAETSGVPAAPRDQPADR